MIPHIKELKRLLPHLHLRLLRGLGADILELLKKGEVELAVATRSLIAIRDRKSGSTKRAFINPSLPTTKVARIGHIQRSLPWNLGRSCTPSIIPCISAPGQIAKFSDSA